MKTAVTKWEELHGKTIEGTFEVCDELLMTFTDGTYTVIESKCGYEGEHETPELDSASWPTHLYIAETSAAAYLKATIWTEEEFAGWKAAIEAKRAEHVAQVAASERQQYERLKAKFEK